MDTRRHTAPATTARYRWFAMLLLGWGALGLGACASMPRAQPIDSIGASETPKFTVTSLIKDGYTPDTRNAWIEFNLIRIDEDYARYEKRLRDLRTQWNVGTSTAALLFNVASSLTASSGVKANYVAANTLAVGANQVVSREEFLEQTVNTLVTAMEGGRAEARKRVRIGMTRDKVEYPVADAYHDLQAYWAAGTLTQGMNFTSDATQKRTDEEIKKADQELKQALIFSEEQLQASTCISKSLENRQMDAAELRKVLDAMGIKYAPADNLDALIAAMDDAREFDTAANEEKLFDLMKTHNLLQPCRRYQ